LGKLRRLQLLQRLELSKQHRSKDASLCYLKVFNFDSLNFFKGQTML
jgi:hypothetical protein